MRTLLSDSMLVEKAKLMAQHLHPDQAIDTAYAAHDQGNRWVEVRMSGGSVLFTVGEIERESRLLTLSDIARELGIDKRTLSGRRQRGRLPEPDHETMLGWPLWERKTLEEAGIL